ncbi:MAG: PD40 domain-containing protein [Nitrospirae bacterium]|nr:PD40 domain-containing protein [Nitrospirota bacterium]
MRIDVNVSIAAAAMLLAITFSQAHAEGGRLLVSNNHDSCITVVDADILEVAGEIPTGNRPSELVADEGGARVYAAIYGTGEVQAIDTASLKVVGKVKAGEKAYALDITRDGRRLVVIDSSEKGDISVVDTASMKVINKAKALQMPVGVRISPDGKTVIVTNAEDKAQVFNLDGLVPVRDINIPREVYEVVYSKDGKMIYFKSVADQEIVILDAATLEVAGRMSADNIDGLAFSGDGKEMWYGGPEGFVTVYSLAENKELARLETRCGHIFQDILFSPDGRQVFVSPGAEDSKSVLVFDAATKTLVKQINLSKMARNLLFLK